MPRTHDTIQSHKLAITRQCRRQPHAMHSCRSPCRNHRIGNEMMLRYMRIIETLDKVDLSMISTRQGSLPAPSIIWRT
ncbi:hypothetical protein PanWU01x14_135870 [Parasponia andersonii]|uniref:Uncharacterized protein n=1 Tax=Parasponia andersonii TaxID=3476 RepID=A0A2P5CPF4_PARAD|nr:hypothetical protein PanWU01x14_135870 [Parasponia andersonii]